MPDRIFADLGDLLGKALIKGDFELYRSILTLPMKFTPRGGKAYQLEDHDALREDFDLYVSIIKLQGVTDIYRQVIGHEQPSEDKIVVQVMADILGRANLLVNPFPSTIRLQLGRHGWLIAEIESLEGHPNWSLGQASVSPAGHFETKGVED